MNEINAISQTCSCLYPIGSQYIQMFKIQKSVTSVAHFDAMFDSSMTFRVCLWCFQNVNNNKKRQKSLRLQLLPKQIELITNLIENPNRFKSNHSPCQCSEPCSRQIDHECEICSQEFRTAVELNAHRRQGCEGLIEIRSNVVECKPTVIDCDDKLTSQSPLKQRKTNRVIMSSEKHQCSECGRRFTKKSNLARHHRLIHSIEAQRNRKAKSVHNCEVCGRQCENELGLKLHRRTHTDEHPFRCDECGRFSTKKSNLLRHCHLAHSDERHQPSVFQSIHAKIGCVRVFRSEWSDRRASKGQIGEFLRIGAARPVLRSALFGRRSSRFIRIELLQSRILFRCGV